MAEKLKSFFIDHVPRQQNAHADALSSLAASLSLPIGIEERVLVYSRDLYCYKFALKTVKLQEKTFRLKRFLRLRQASNQGLVIPLH